MRAVICIRLIRLSDDPLLSLNCRRIYSFGSKALRILIGLPFYLNNFIILPLFSWQIEMTEPSCLELLCEFSWRLHMKLIIIYNGLSIEFYRPERKKKIKQKRSNYCSPSLSVEFLN